MSGWPVVQLEIPAAGVRLAADLTIPQDACGIVVFAHGSGSSRRSPRNRLVAECLNQGALGTLLFDLLSEEEGQEDRRTAELRFDIALLASRLTGAVDWLAAGASTSGFPLGCFGASTGAAAALIAAARRPAQVRAVVSRGGRPDLAQSDLSRVRAPTLLIVGGADPTVARLNRQAQQHMANLARLEVVEDAGHLFEEPGALERVAALARDWFAAHLAAS